MVTQVEVARRVGLDVSSVNKILNRCVGPVFRKETIRLVFKTAKEMGYNLHRPNKHFFINVVAEIFTQDMKDEFFAAMLGMTVERVKEIKAVLARTPHRKDFVHDKKYTIMLAPKAAPEVKPV